MGGTRARRLGALKIAPHKNRWNRNIQVGAGDVGSNVGIRLIGAPQTRGWTVFGWAVLPPCPDCPADAGMRRDCRCRRRGESRLPRRRGDAPPTYAAGKAGMQDAPVDSGMNQRPGTLATVRGRMPTDAGACHIRRRAAGAGRRDQGRTPRTNEPAERSSTECGEPWERPATEGI